MTTDQVIARLSRMWSKAGKQFSDAIPDAIIAGDMHRAIHLALCAEACFWKATGETDTHGIKDLLPLIAEQRDKIKG